MSHSLFDSDVPHPEPSNLTAFDANDLNRDSEHRDEQSVEKALAKEGTHIFAFAGDKLVLKHDGQVLDPLFARYEL
ncbi:NADH pyrophosphatase, partial [Rhizobium leguminosarum]